MDMGLHTFMNTLAIIYCHISNMRAFEEPLFLGDISPMIPFHTNITRMKMLSNDFSPFPELDLLSKVHGRGVNVLFDVLFNSF